MAAPFVFLYPIIHEYKKARCMPDFTSAGQAFDLHDLSGKTATRPCRARLEMCYPMAHCAPRKGADW
jgi:hypothetical protein